MNEEVFVEVKDKNKASRSFNIHVDGNVFDVVVDEKYVYVQGKKIGRADPLKPIKLGSKRISFLVQSYPSGFGLKKINLWIKNKNIYFEKVENVQASKIEARTEKITAFLVYLLFPGWFIFAFATLTTNWLLQFLVKWFKISQIDKQFIDFIILAVGVVAVLVFVIRLMEKPVNKGLLIEKKTIEEIESQHLYDGVPFGLINDDWDKFKSCIEEGDEIWLWRTPPMTWKMLTGREGYVIVRDGKTTKHSILVGMN